VQQGLGWPQTARHIMRRMVERGLLQLLAPGVYGLAG
jgi:hypothetical protein